MDSKDSFGFGYSYDRVGLRDRMQDAILHADGTQDGGLHQYSYDRLYRLISAQHPLAQQAFNPNEGFSYDFVGNRTSGPNGANIQYDRANRITSDDKFTYAFDANGNMVSKTDRATGAKTIYTYDVENQLIRIDFPDGTWVMYRYDGLGRRFEKNVNGSITRWVYDNEDIHLEYDGANQLKAAYVHGIGIDEPLIMYRGGKSYYYHADGLGSIVQLTDAQGNVVKSYIYNSFGNVVKETGAIENPYTYTGRERDIESGLYYYRARYYDPWQGRFIHEDPIAFRGGINFYTYVANSPTNFIDPNGLGKIGAIIKIAKKGAKVVRKLVTEKQAQKALRKGDDILVERRQIAKRIGSKEYGKENLIHHNPHGPGGYAHYQAREGARYGKEHIFYGKPQPLHAVIPGATLGSDIKNSFFGCGENFIGTAMEEAINFFNPMSDIQDIKDLISSIFD